MPTDINYRVNSPKVILETFADEVVIVNLDSGNYYSTDKTGAEIWALVANGATVAEISHQIGLRYEALEQDIDLAIRAWIEQLLQEDLIVPFQADASRPVSAIASPGKVKQPFEPPVLQKYTDMQELLLLDPIHEVDETGWPNVPGPVAGSSSESKE